MCDELEAMGGGDTRVGRLETYCRILPVSSGSGNGGDNKQVAWVESGEDCDEVVVVDPRQPSTASKDQVC